MGYSSYSPKITADLKIGPHDDTLSGGALAHWFIGTDSLVESIVGGAGFDVTSGFPLYSSINGGSAGGDLAFNTAERAPGVLTMDASLKLTAAMTIAGWFCPMSAIAGGSAHTLFSAENGEANPRYWFLRCSTAGVLQFGWGSTVVTMGSTTTATRGGWYHMCGTRSADASPNGKLYINGVEEDSVIAAAAQAGTGTQINLGHNGGGGEKTVGLFSVVLYSSELNAAAVTALYNSSIVPV